MTGVAVPVAGAADEHRSAGGAPRRRRRWLAAAAIVALLALLAALALRAASERAPVLVLSRTLPSSVRLPGPAPALSWPAAGQAAVVVEGIGSLGRSGPSAAVPIASVAKVMTAYLTLQRFPLATGAGGFVMTVSAADVRDYKRRRALGQSVAAVRVGERLDERAALQALLLPSANNVAVMLASRVAGSIPAFVAQMNATARSLGMGETVYTDPSGFDASTVSTATDQLRLARVAMRVRALATIVDEPAATIPVAGRVANIDTLVRRDGYVGIKTGSDGAADGCLMFAKQVLVGGRRLTVLGVVLGQPGASIVDAALASARRLGDSAAAALRLTTVVRRGEPVLRASSADGRGTAVVAARSLRTVGWGGLRVRIGVAVLPAAQEFPTGTRLASVTLIVSHPDSASAVAASAVGGPSLGWRLRHLL